MVNQHAVNKTRPQKNTMGGLLGDVIHLTACWLTLVVIGGPSTIASASSGGARQREISVSRGSATFIRPSDLGLDLRPDPVITGIVCMISVVGDDPGSLRVGRVYPEVGIYLEAYQCNVYVTTLPQLTAGCCC